jgi:hypothetical protein
MICKPNFKLAWILFVLNLGPITSSLAQNSSIELWPGVDIWYRLNPNWRLPILNLLSCYNYRGCLLYLPRLINKTTAVNLWLNAYGVESLLRNIFFFDTDKLLVW